MYHYTAFMDKKSRGATDYTDRRHGLHGRKRVHGDYTDYHGGGRENEELGVRN